ncbi:MAG TPA: NAD(P)H-dependent glycerol-3-phosphate dehydrogenase [Fibrobacteraceae bacterium]|nr:NAD(P)H-dependent glycerol-3-phosphate dehydrogenase [Fibrobacteraceae bacterium]
MKIAILGTGGWGLTLGKHLFESGNSVVFWTHSSEEAELLSRENEYRDKLPGVKLPSGLRYFTHLPTAIGGAEMIVLVVPSQFTASVARQLAEIPPSGASPILVSAAKGITEDSLQRMSEVLLSNIPWLRPENVVTLSGPSHAEEVSRGIPTTVVSAGPGVEQIHKVQALFSNRHLRVYTCDDQLGVELAGALKNVIAIATGILDGLGLGDNTKGALMTRGLAEITRLGEAMGANPRTFAGLAGMGDLITTCMSRHSRNRYVGEHIGKGEPISTILSGMKMVAEGVPTCRSAHALAQKLGVEMPITAACYEVLFSGKSVQEALDHLMQRELKSEIW